MDEQTYLYRHFDAAGILLYIGISNSVEGRLNTHRRYAPWAEQVARTTRVSYESRRAAEQAERRAIREENPLWNRHRPAAEPVETVSVSVCIPCRIHALLSDLKKRGVIVSIQREILECVERRVAELVAVPGLGKRQVVPDLERNWPIPAIPFKETDNKVPRVLALPKPLHAQIKNLIETTLKARSINGLVVDALRLHFEAFFASVEQSVAEKAEKPAPPVATYEELADALRALYDAMQYLTPSYPPQIKAKSEALAAACEVLIRLPTKTRG